MIKKIISGGQSGADLGGLLAAETLGIETGGWMPKGFLTENGPRPAYAERFNIIEHSSSKYPPRTEANAANSDGTIRFAFDFTTAGEVCTLKAINKFNKPYFDVDVMNPPPVEAAINWIKENNIQVLNIAGNREKTYNGMAVFVHNYLIEVVDGIKRTVS